MSSDRFDVVVIGAGVAGLVAAVEAAKGGARTLVLDARPAGGRARTTDREGYLFNEGPHALFEQGAFMAVLKRWGLEPSGRRPQASGAHVFRGDTLHPFPTGPGRLARTPLLKPASRIRFGRLMTRLPRLDTARLVGRSVSEWFDDEDLPEDVRALVLTLVRVTSYGNAPELMDAGAAVTQLRAGLQGCATSTVAGRASSTGWPERSRQRAARCTPARPSALSTPTDDRPRCMPPTARSRPAAVILAGLPPAEAARLLGPERGRLRAPGPAGRGRLPRARCHPPGPTAGRVRSRSPAVPVGPRARGAPGASGPRDRGGDALPPAGARAGCRPGPGRAGRAGVTVRYRRDHHRAGTVPAAGDGRPRAPAGSGGWPGGPAVRGGAPACPTCCWPVTGSVPRACSRTRRRLAPLASAGAALRLLASVPTCA